MCSLRVKCHMCACISCGCESGCVVVGHNLGLHVVARLQDMACRVQLFKQELLIDLLTPESRLSANCRL